MRTPAVDGEISPDRETFGVGLSVTRQVVIRIVSKKLVLHSHRQKAIVIKNCHSCIDRCLGQDPFIPTAIGIRALVEDPMHSVDYQSVTAWDPFA